MNLCKNCRYVKVGTQCDHPNNIDLVTGDHITISCYSMRDTVGKCGPEGKWFMGKELAEPILNEKARPGYGNRT